MRILAVMILALLVAACGDDDQAARSFEFQEMVDQGLMRYVGAASPRQSVTVGDSTVFEFDPADGPVCLAGAPFRVATRSGQSNDLVIYLQGGGACNSQICQVTTVTTDTTLSNGVPGAGVLSASLAANPVRDWNVLYSPYCDGSLMAGDVEIDTDGDGVVDRYQKGLRNLSAALDVAVAEFPEPSRILLTGVSAGGFATLTALPMVRFHYRDAEILVLNDAGVGIASGEEGSLVALASEWNSSSALPASCTECFATDQLMPVLGWQLDRDPNLRIGIVTSKRDLVIAATFVMIPGDQFEAALLEQSGRLRNRHPERFKRFIYAGNRHTTLAIQADTELGMAGGFTDIDPEVLDMILGRYDVTNIEGVTVADWVTSMLAATGWDDLVAQD